MTPESARVFRRGSLATLILSAGLVAMLALAARAQKPAECPPGALPTKAGQCLYPWGTSVPSATGDQDLDLARTICDAQNHLDDAFKEVRTPGWEEVCERLDKIWSIKILQIAAKNERDSKIFIEKVLGDKP